MSKARDTRSDLFRWTPVLSVAAAMTLAGAVAAQSQSSSSSTTQSPGNTNRTESRSETYSSETRKTPDGRTIRTESGTTRSTTTESSRTERSTTDSYRSNSDMHRSNMDRNRAGMDNRAGDGHFRTYDGRYMTYGNIRSMTAGERQELRHHIEIMERLSMHEYRQLRNMGISNRDIAGIAYVAHHSGQPATTVARWYFDQYGRNLDMLAVGVGLNPTFMWRAVDPMSRDFEHWDRK